MVGFKAKKDLLRKNEHSNDQDDRPSELYRNRNTVASSVIPVLGGVQHHCCQEQPDCDRPLIATNDRASNPFRGGL